MMGIVMKKVSLSIAAVTVAAMGIGSASAADLPAKVYTKAPAPVVVSPWDVAFGAAITNNYVFRGISQSNRNASVSAYFEPRYNLTPDLQLYAGVARLLKSTSTAVSARPSALSLSTSVSGATSIRVDSASTMLPAAAWSARSAPTRL